MFTTSIPPHDPDRKESIDNFADPEGESNGSRAAMAANAINADRRCQEDYSDLITNILHLAHSEGHDPEEILTAVILHFEQEAGQLPVKATPESDEEKSRDNLSEVLTDAKRVAAEYGNQIAVVHDPIANAEESGDYGYCPVAAIPTLFRHGRHTHTVSPDGTVTVHPA